MFIQIAEALSRVVMCIPSAYNLVTDIDFSTHLGVNFNGENAARATLLIPGGVAPGASGKAIDGRDNYDGTTCIGLAEDNAAIQKWNRQQCRHNLREKNECS